MNQPSGLLAEAFPAPPPALAALLDELRVAASIPAENEKDLRRLALLPRPWDPATCPPELRQNIYVWLDGVVAWINEQHTWRVEKVIPLCWDLHPHIVHELATVACQRWDAGFALTSSVLEDWHRYTLPMFLDRVAQRIGATGCPPGRHQLHPGADRNKLYRADEESARRLQCRWRDTEG